MGIPFAKTSTGGGTMTRTSSKEVEVGKMVEVELGQCAVGVSAL